MWRSRYKYKAKGDAESASAESSLIPLSLTSVVSSMTGLVLPAKRTKEQNRNPRAKSYWIAEYGRCGDLEIVVRMMRFIDD
jgi:hypothetical protein